MMPRMLGDDPVLWEAAMRRRQQIQDETGYPIPRRPPPAPGAVPVENTREPTPAGRDAKPHSPQYHSRDARKIKKP